MLLQSCAKRLLSRRLGSVSSAAADRAGPSDSKSRAIMRDTNTPYFAPFQAAGIPHYAQVTRQQNASQTKPVRVSSFRSPLPMLISLSTNPHSDQKQPGCIRFAPMRTRQGSTDKLALAVLIFRDRLQLQPGATRISAMRLLSMNPTNSIANI